MTNLKNRVIIVKVYSFTVDELEAIVMGKDLNYAMLLDCYGDLLTDKQKDIMQLYYYEDLSLSEIAENENITRQGVHDAIKRAEQYLTGFEEKLGFLEKTEQYKKAIKKIKECTLIMDQYNIKYSYSKNIAECINEITSCIEQSEELFR